MPYLRRSVNTNKDRPTCWMGPIGFPNSLRNKTIYGENVETPARGFSPASRATPGERELRSREEPAESRLRAELPAPR